jgi:hypothetical protein
MIQIHSLYKRLNVSYDQYMKNTQKGFITPLLVIIAVLVIGGGFYYSYSKKTLNTENMGLQTQTNVQQNTGVSTQPSRNTPSGTSNDPTPSQKATISVLLPTKNQSINISSPMKVIWKTSSDFSFPQVTITVVTSNDGQTAFDSITVSNTGSASITVPKSVGVVPYKILIQGSPYSGRGEAPFAYSDEFFFTGGVHTQMLR